MFFFRRIVNYFFFLESEYQPESDAKKRTLENNEKSEDKVPKSK